MLSRHTPAARLLILLLLGVVLALAGCAPGEDEELFPAESGETLNPRYEQITDDAPSCPLEVAVDEVMRPALTEVFGGAKLISSDTCEEEVLQETVYVVPAVFTVEAAESLNDALEAVDGVEPTSDIIVDESAETVTMTYTFDLEGGQVPVEIVMDLDDQVVRLNAG